MRTVAKPETSAQRNARLAKLKEKGESALRDPEYHPDPRQAARHLDGQLMKARGETPPWEKQEGDVDGETA